MSEVALSAAVMVYNGRDTIERCLDALAFCDEVVVVDDVSTDGTWEYLQARPGVRAVQHRHTTFAAQRTYARDLCRGEWVLTMDADEYVSEALAQAIRAAIAAPHAPDGFRLRHRTPYPGGLAGFSWADPPRLVRRDRCRWIPTDNPHSPLDERGLVMRTLDGGWIDHEPLPDLATAMRKIVNRSLVLASQGRVAGRRPGLWRLLAASAYHFFKALFREGHWRHGRDGVVVASLAAFTAYTKYAFMMTGEARPESLDGGPGSIPAAGKDSVESSLPAP